MDGRRPVRECRAQDPAYRSTRPSPPDVDVSCARTRDVIVRMQRTWSIVHATRKRVTPYAETCSGAHALGNVLVS